MSVVYPGYLPQGASGGQIGDGLIWTGTGTGPAGISGDPYTDQQHQWMLEYKIDPVTMGEMCEKFTALAKSWSQFKIVYDLCRSEENNG
jgi:hypothetical protein